MSLPPLRPNATVPYLVELHLNEREALFITRRERRTGLTGEEVVQNLLGQLERTRADKVEAPPEELAKPKKEPTVVSAGMNKRLVGFTLLTEQESALGGKRATKLRVHLNDFERMSLDRQQGTFTPAHNLPDGPAVLALMADEEEQLATLWAQRELLIAKENETKKA